MASTSRVYDFSKSDPEPATDMPPPITRKNTAIVERKNGEIVETTYIKKHAQSDQPDPVAETLQKTLQAIKDNVKQKPIKNPKKKSDKKSDKISNFEGYGGNRTRVLRRKKTKRRNSTRRRRRHRHRRNSRKTFLS